MHSQMDGYANICTDIHTYIHIVHVYVCVCVCFILICRQKVCIMVWIYEAQNTGLYIKYIYE